MWIDQELTWKTPNGEIHYLWRNSTLLTITNMGSESSPPIMNDTGYRWEDRTAGYCHHCDGYVIQCPDCQEFSCTGGGCNKCCSRDGNEATNFFLRFSRNYKEITRNWFLPEGFEGMAKNELSFFDQMCEELEGTVKARESSGKLNQ